MMKAAVVDRYGPPEAVRVQEVPEPACRRGAVVVRVRAAALSSGDARIRGARFPRGLGSVARLAIGVRGPRRPVLGMAVSGVVEEVGDRVTHLVVGDEVAGMTGFAMGAHAEVVTVKANRLVGKPTGVSHADAAGVLFGGATAMHFLRGRVRPGARVLVNGASGSVGTAAVQLVRLAGGSATGICSGANAELVTELGADVVLDYARTPLETVRETYDLVMDTVGNMSTALGRSLLAPDGVLLQVVADLPKTLKARGDVVAGTSSERPEDFAELLDLVASGELDAVVGRTFSLDEVVEAHRLVDSGRKVGNVVLVP